jgi:hypothetical protein
VRSDNTSGVKGIYWTRNIKWRPNISVMGKRIYLGLYEKIEDAILIRNKMEKQNYAV